MANILTLDLDFSVLDQYQGLPEEVQKAIEESVADLAASAHAHIVEEATHKLHSLQEQFIKNLPEPEEIDKNTWLITIPGKGDQEHDDISWIDDGIPANFNMLPGLLNSENVKSGKNGKYLVVPFKHNKKPTQQTVMAKTLAKSILSEMNKRGISRNKIEKNPDGSPKIGLLHSFSTQPQGEFAGPRQKNQVKPPNQGPAGQHYQTKPRPNGQEGPGGRPYSYGVKVYQKENKQTGGVDRNVVTFRTASEKQDGRMWVHPGLQGLHSIEEAYKWAETQMESVILPELVKRFGLG
jgi:hypothetical protein